MQNKNSHYSVCCEMWYVVDKLVIIMLINSIY